MSIAANGHRHMNGGPPLMGEPRVETVGICAVPMLLAGSGIEFQDKGAPTRSE
jgi:hypothetical protein